MSFQPNFASTKNEKTVDYEDIYNDDQYAVGARHGNGE